jgi:hypothetical protein
VREGAGDGGDAGQGDLGSQGLVQGRPASQAEGKNMELAKKLAGMKQPAALPGHLRLQAAHRGRDGPDLLLQPLITSSSP